MTRVIGGLVCVGVVAFSGGPGGMSGEGTLGGWRGRWGAEVQWEEGCGKRAVAAVLRKG